MEGLPSTTKAMQSLCVFGLRNNRYLQFDSPEITVHRDYRFRVFCRFSRGFYPSKKIIYENLFVVVIRFYRLL